MTEKHFIQLKLGNKTFKDKVSTEGCSDVSDFKSAIKNKFSPELDSYAPHHLTLFQPDGITEIDPETLVTDLKYIPRNPMIVTVNELCPVSAVGSSKNQVPSKGINNLVNKEMGVFKKEERTFQAGKSFPYHLISGAQVKKRESELFGEESMGIKKPRLSIAQTLVSSLGSDFHFSDRDESFEILASSLEERFYCRQVELKDKMLHKLTFLADGTGSGKSRFLQ